MAPTSAHVPRRLIVVGEGSSTSQTIGIICAVVAGLSLIIMMFRCIARARRNRVPVQSAVTTAPNMQYNQNPNLPPPMAGALPPNAPYPPSQPPPAYPPASYPSPMYNTGSSDPSYIYPNSAKADVDGHSARAIVL